MEQFDLAWLSGIIGVALPLLISLVKRVSWSTQFKRVVAVVASVIAGAVAVGLDGGWALNSDFFRLALLNIVGIYTVASVTYQNFWSGTALETKLAAIGN